MKRIYLLLMALASLFIVACSSDGDDSGNKKPTPTPTPAESVIKYDLAPTAKILDQATAACITNVDTTRNTFLISGVTDDKVPAVGSCIIVNTPTEELPQGLLAKVLDVKSEGSGYRVTFADAELTDAFENLKVENVQLDLADKAVTFYDPNGKPIPITKTRAAEHEPVEISFPDLEWKITDNLSVTPHLSAKILLQPEMEISHWILTKFNTRTVVTPSLGADFSLSADKDIVDKRFKLGTLTCGGIAVGPLVITPNIEFFLLFKVGGKISLEGSISYSRTIDFKTIYSLDDGNIILDATLDNYLPDGGGLNVSLGSKLEGSVSYGMGTGPTLAIYRKVAYTGISIDCMLKESISGQINFAEFASQEGFNFFKWKGVECKYDFTAKAHYYVGSMDHETGKDTPEYSHNIDSRKLMPQVASSVEKSFEGNKARLTAKINEKSFFPYQLLARFEKQNARKDEKPVETYFDFGEYGKELLEHGKQIEVTAEADLEPGDIYNYTVIAEVEVMGEKFDLPVVKGEISPDGDPEASIRAILAALYKCRDGQWDGCNWDNEYTELSKMKNVKIGSGDSYVSDYTFTIPQNWKIRKEGFYVGNYSRFINSREEEKGCTWDIVIEGNRDLDSIIIEDRNFRSITMSGGSLDKLAYRNSQEIPTPSYIFEKFNASVNTLDLSGSNVGEFNLHAEKVWFPKKELILNNCSRLKYVNFYGSYNKRDGVVPHLQAYNSNFSRISATYMKVPDYVFDELSPTDDALTIHIENCDAGCFILTGKDVTNFELKNSTYTYIDADNSSKILRLDLEDVQGDSVRAVSCPNLTHLIVNKRFGPCQTSKVVCKSCPKLVYLGASDIELTSLEIEDLPSIDNLLVHNNKGLTGLVPAVIDDMYARGKGITIGYDRRFHYFTGIDGTISSSDSGYGFYYEGEPERGYHRK